MPKLYEGIGRLDRQAHPLVRFWKNVDSSGDCWLWTGTKNGRGRGTLGIEGKSVFAHRFSYEQLVGSIPDGLYVCHHCDNPICVNPKHLFLGTQDDNMKDMVSKDRSNKPKGEENGRAKLKEDDVRFIRTNYMFRHPIFGMKPLALYFGVCWHTIHEIIHYKKWSHVR